MEAAPPIAGEDAEWQAASSSRRRRALTLIALSVVVIVASGFAYLHPPSISKAKSTELAVAPPPPISMSMSSDSGRVPRPPLTELFRSPKMRYSINFPVGWTVTPATQIWRGEWDTWGKPNVDELDGSSVVFTGTSEPLAWGTVAGEMDRLVSRSGRD